MLTDDDIVALEKEYGPGFRNLNDREWRDIAAALPPGPNGRDMFFYLFLVNANRYWRDMAATPTTKHSLRQLDKLLKDARADLKRERNSRLSARRRFGRWDTLK
jgi:uncharacterized protein with von Willebrand factor type A (vWA) domain